MGTTTQIRGIVAATDSDSVDSAWSNVKSERYVLHERSKQLSVVCNMYVMYKSQPHRGH